MMIEHRTDITVRYSEADRMGFCYYGNYAVYFEVARVETLKSIGLRYRDIEDMGILLPVRDYTVRFFKPALYDDTITVVCRIRKKVTASIVFEYETFNQQGILLNEACITLVFTDKSTKKPIRPPEEISDLIDAYL